MGDEQTAVALARLEGKVDGILFRLDQGAKDHENHESRITSLERKFWIVAGFASGIGGVTGATLFRIFNS